MGSYGYKRMINELRKNVYSESDHEDLAKHLDLLAFYAELTEMNLVGLKEIPEVGFSLSFSLGFIEIFLYQLY